MERCSTRPATTSCGCGRRTGEGGGCTGGVAVHGLAAPCSPFCVMRRKGKHEVGSVLSCLSSTSLPLSPAAPAACWTRSPSCSACWRCAPAWACTRSRGAWAACGWRPCSPGTTSASTRSQTYRGCRPCQPGPWPTTAPAAGRAACPVGCYAAQLCAACGAMPALQPLCLTSTADAAARHMTPPPCPRRRRLPGLAGAGPVV